MPEDVMERWIRGLTKRSPSAPLMDIENTAAAKEEVTGSVKRKTGTDVQVKRVQDFHLADR